MWTPSQSSAAMVPLEICVKNALIATEVADTYFPPVYSGMSRPIVKEKLFSADYVHGSDGLGEMNLPYPAHQPEKQHAVDALVEHIMASDGELELITLGPADKRSHGLPQGARHREKAEKALDHGRHRL